MTTYTFESGDEGFTAVESANGTVETLPYTFPNWLTPETGLNDVYTFELVNVQYYNITQSTNGYSTVGFVEMVNERIPHPLNYALRRLLKQVKGTNPYGAIIFNGEM